MTFMKYMAENHSPRTQSASNYIILEEVLSSSRIYLIFATASSWTHRHRTPRTIMTFPPSQPSYISKLKCLWFGVPRLSVLKGYQIGWL